MPNIIFSNIDSNEDIAIETLTTDLQYAQYILGDPTKDYSNISHYSVTTSYNCCDPGITTIIAPQYDLSVVTFSCILDQPNIDLYTFRLEGINASLVTNMTFTVNGNTPIDGSYTVVSDRIVFGDLISTTNAVTSYELTITTTQGFTYIFTFDLTQDGTSCNGTFSNFNTTYTLPDNIVEYSDGEYASITVSPSLTFQFTLTANNRGVIGNTISIVPDGVTTLAGLVLNWNTSNPSNTISLDCNNSILENTYVPLVTDGPWNLTGGTVSSITNALSFQSLFGFSMIPDGVYQVIICEHYDETSSTCIQNHVFIDQDNSIRCQVVNKLVQCVDSNIMDLYQALLWGNDCTDTLSYTEMCAIYELLNILITSDGCYGRLDDCNCTGISTISNNTTPINYPSGIGNNSNPCQSC